MESKLSQQLVSPKCYSSLLIQLHPVALVGEEVNMSQTMFVILEELVSSLYGFEHADVMLQDVEDFVVKRRQTKNSHHRLKTSSYSMFEVLIMKRWFRNKQ